MSEVLVEEYHGGSKRSVYFYVVSGKEVLHISQLPNASKVKEERIRKEVKIVRWRVPRDNIAGRQVMIFIFTSAGRRPMLSIAEEGKEGEREELVEGGFLISRVYRAPKNVEELSIRAVNEGFELIAKNALNYMLEQGLSFRYFGPEEDMMELYKELVPSLVRDIKETCSRLGLSHEAIASDSPGLIEALKDPMRALLAVLAVPSPQGRIRNIYERIRRVYEAWLLLRTLKPLVEEGGELQKNYLVLQSGALEPAAELKIGARYISLFYNLVVERSEDLRRRVMPTFLATVTRDKLRVFSVSDIEKCITSSRLALLVRMNLLGKTDYEKQEYLVSQVELLKERARRAKRGAEELRIAAVIIEPNPHAVSSLRVRGIEAFSGLVPGSRELLRYEDFVKSSLAE